MRSPGCRLEAAEAVCAADGALGSKDVLDVLAALVDKSLLRVRLDRDGEPRFWMLETISEYARERLAGSGAEDALRRRHAAYFLALTDEAHRGLRGPGQALWLEPLESEADNLRAALTWLNESGRKGE